MQWNIKRWLATLITASAALLSACGGGGSSEHETLDVVRLAKSNANLSVLAEAIDAAGLATTLSAAGPYTVFAPTNQAFLDLLAELKVSKAELLANKDLLTSVLTYHVLGSKVVSSAVPLGQPIATLQKGFLHAENLGGSLKIKDESQRVSNVVTADVVARNGVVHIIDKVLLPANTSTNVSATFDIVRLAKSNANLSVLAEAIDAAGLATTLSAAGPYTVFAPTNQAFLDLLAELKMSKADLLANKDFLTSVLTYHVLGSKVVSSAVPLGQPITTVQKGFFKAETLGRSLTITDGRNRFSNVVTADVVAQNGVVHLIDKVLLPANKNVLQTAIALSTEAQPEFSILVEAVVAADLVTTLSGDGPFTVFAPNNAAFAALLTELGTTKAALLADKPLLTKVLTYHVVPGLVLKAQVPVGSPITTVQKDTFTVNAALAITDQRARSAKITATDVLASNGVIHAIDKVILPKP